MWYRYFVKLLKSSFDEAQQRNAAVSLRRYAQRIGTSPGMVSEIFRGQRRISFERALRIAEKAEFTPKAIEKLQELHRRSDSKSARVTLKDHALDLILNTRYSRILCALEILGNKANLKQLMKSLEMDKNELTSALELLKEVGVVETEKDRVTWNGQYMIAKEKISPRKIQSYFRGNLKEVAKDLQLPLEERAYSTLVFPGTMLNMAEAKDLIAAFQDSLSDSMRGETPDQIFQLSIQLRPLSRQLETNATANEGFSGREGAQS